MARPEIIKKLPSVKVLKSLLDYNPETGQMTWRYRPLSSFEPKGKRTAVHLYNFHKTKFAGMPAGSTRQDGYACIVIDGVAYKRSRIAWKMETGKDPVVIDHINGNRGDDRFENLRSVLPVINARNAGIYSTNTSGVPGVEWHKRDEIWTAKIGVGGRQVHLGNFKTKEEAIACRIGAEMVLQYHPNHGRKL